MVDYSLVSRNCIARRESGDFGHAHGFDIHAQSGETRRLGAWHFIQNLLKAAGGMDRVIVSAISLYEVWKYLDGITGQKEPLQGIRGMRDRQTAPPHGGMDGTPLEITEKEF